MMKNLLYSERLLKRLLLISGKKSIPHFDCQGHLRILYLETPDLGVSSTIFSQDDPDLGSMLTSMCPVEMVSSETLNVC